MLILAPLSAAPLLLSFASVALSTIPETLILFFFWNVLRAASVSEPKMPSTFSLAWA